MMLTRSPVPPTSANASPSFRGFHYAPALPSLSPSRVSTALSRRPSTSTSSPANSMKSPSQPRPKRYVAVDAATQYSPMEPFNYVPPAPASSSSSQTPLELPSTPQVVPMEPGIEQGAEQGQPSQPADAPPAATVASTSNGPPVAGSSRGLVSPQKRRSSEEPSTASEGHPSVVNSPSTFAKRPKGDSRPPKILPQRYELCPVEDMVVLISNMLGELIETNDALALKSGHLTRFHSRTAPGISVLDYLHRLAKHATLSPPLLLSMVYYIDRLCLLYPDFTINTLTVHRFLITAATVAAKGLSDSFWNNSTYARVGGVRVAELKLLELEFLYRVDWKIVPNPEVLVAYYKGLVERSPGYIFQGEESSGDDDEDDEEEEEEEEDDDVLLDDEDEGDVAENETETSGDEDGEEALSLSVKEEAGSG